MNTFNVGVRVYETWDALYSLCQHSRSKEGEEGEEEEADGARQPACFLVDERQ